jgi:ATPase subunit of ABC transporter with duplicated ATPase domains
LTAGLFSKSKAPRSATASTPDDDVVAEEELVLSRTCEGDAIAIKRLTKVYDDGKVAVDNLSLGIAPGECFGLLGINGKSFVTCLFHTRETNLITNVPLLSSKQERERQQP